jgi:DNA replication and repair protein RecF
LYIKSIKLNNFRNHEEKKFELSTGTNVFYGDNAQGKTNILESIYFCSIGKSFRAKKDSELVMQGKEVAALEMEFVKGERTKKINTVITDKNKKQIKINDIKANKISELLGNILIVLFSPEDTEIVKGDPSNRRKFFDLLSHACGFFIQSISPTPKLFITKALRLSVFFFTHRPRFLTLFL